MVTELFYFVPTVGLALSKVALQFVSPFSIGESFLMSLFTFLLNSIRLA